MMKNFRHYFAPVIAGTVLFAASCTNSVDPNENNQVQNALQDSNSETTTSLVVKPPIPGVDVPYTNYAVSAEKGMSIETKTGTVIEIPAGAFVDKDGKAITEEVNIKFREFHDATDLIACGIPMQNPETGEYMETAGMFEISGTCKGQEVFVHPEKDIEVNLASFNEGDDFNFYELDANKGTWADKGTAKCQPNRRKAKRLAELDAALPSKPIKPRKHSDVENYVFDLDVNYSMFPELKPFKGVVWEYAGEGKDPEKNEWIFSENWDKIGLNKSDATGYFELVLSDSKKKFRTLVRPVLDDDNYEEALALFSETKMKEYGAIKEAQEDERNRLAMQANLTRSFRISGFGTYNWDIWHQPGRKRCAAAPEFDQLAKVDKDINKNISYFLVMGGRRAIVQYDRGTLSKFSFNPNDDNALLAVLPGGKVAIFSASDFKKLDMNKIINSKKAIMHMATSTINVETLENLDEVIDAAMTS